MAYRSQKLFAKSAAVAGAGFFILQLYAADVCIAQTNSAGAGLEANGPAVQSAPPLTVLRDGGASMAPAPPMPAAGALEAPEAVPPLAMDRAGKLESYIRHNPSIRKTEQLRSDPRMNALAQAVRGDFLNEFGTLMFSTAVPSRDSLLERTRALDKEQMELADRSIDLRINLASFRMEQAAVAEALREQTGATARFGADLKNFRSDLTAFGVSLGEQKQRKADYDSQMAAHNREARDYTAQCIGRRLPPAEYATCSAWERRLSARKEVLDNLQAQVDSIGDALLQKQADLLARHKALEARRTALEERQAQLAEQTVRLDARGKQLAAEESKLADWQRALQPQWEFEIKHIDEWRALLDRFNARLEAALNQVQAPPTTPPAVTGFSGNWSDADKGAVSTALDAIKDSELRDWIVTHAELNRFKDDNFSPLTAFNSTLRFKDGFFGEKPARQENLLAFEAGKVFWNQMKNRTLGSGQTLEAWFIAYSGGNASIIAEMRMAKHGGDDMSSYADLADAPSQFGHIFRASALRLERTSGASQQDLDRVAGEFRARIGPLLRANQ